MPKAKMVFVSIYDVNIQDVSVQENIRISRNKACE